VITPEVYVYSGAALIPTDNGATLKSVSNILSSDPEYYYPPVTVTTESALLYLQGAGFPPLIEVYGYEDQDSSPPFAYNQEYAVIMLPPLHP